MIKRESKWLSWNQMASRLHKNWITIHCTFGKCFQHYFRFAIRWRNIRIASRRKQMLPIIQTDGISWASWNLKSNIFAGSMERTLLRMSDRNVAGIIRKGIGFIYEEVSDVSIKPQLSISESISLNPSLGTFGSRPFVLIVVQFWWTRILRLKGQILATAFKIYSSIGAV